MKRAMLDLETLGNRPGSVISSIGAVWIGQNEGAQPPFYMRVDAQSCVDAGLKMDVSTVHWWMRQDDAARQELMKPAPSLGAVLRLFTTWLGNDLEEVWGNGAGFDNVLLGAAYDAMGVRRPWRHSQDRCYRTMKNLPGAPAMEREGLHHHALDDARSQALHLVRIESWLRGDAAVSLEAPRGGHEGPAGGAASPLKRGGTSTAALCASAHHGRTAHSPGGTDSNGSGHCPSTGGRTSP